MTTYLTDEQIQQYRRDGYLVIPDLLTADEVEAFLQHESKPKPGEWRKGLLTHTVDPQWKYLATHPKISGIAAQLLHGLPMIVQTMYMNKPPAGGKGIALHQDTHYIRNEPNSLMACWVAMSDTDPDNGGLCVVPGSHLGELRKAHLAKDPEEHIAWETDYHLRDRDGKTWTERLVSFEVADLSPDEIVKLTVPCGGGVFFTGMTIHGSFANRSADRPRRAFAVHYVREGTWVFRQDIQDVTPAIQG